jgi:hypothetical protein
MATILAAQMWPNLSCPTDGVVAFSLDGLSHPWLEPQLLSFICQVANCLVETSMILNVCQKLWPKHSENYISH